MRAMYSLREIRSSPDLEVLKRRRSATLVRLAVSSWMPSLRFLENYS